MTKLVRRLLRPMWSRRAHGYRPGDDLKCARCGGFEYAEYHPRGWWLLRRPLIERLP